MAEQLTEQQREAVVNRGGKLLVSAAAGSGKTKVLVDRLLGYLKDPVAPANIDDFLIITYTKAAAAELRGKIAAKLSQEIAENPANRHLQKQLQRLYLANISTVHSFCSDILREFAFYLDIPVDFRVAEENECLEMQYEIIDQVLDAAYESGEADPDFYAFVDSQGFGRNDRQLPEVILKLYKSAKCHMDPEAWLTWCLESADVSDGASVTDLVWARYLIDDLHSYIDMQIAAFRKCAEAATDAVGMQKPVLLFYETIDRLQQFRNYDKWDEIVSHGMIDFGKLSFPTKNVDEEMRDRMKAVREACKEGLKKRLRRFADNEAQILEGIASTSAAARGMVAITRAFSAAYDKLKRRKRVLDFADLEHKMLELLLGKRRYGPTAIALEISKRFREVLVDEYQDSNRVQDAIFNAITGERQNFFMVGDVKQSIYQFRLAEPGIFLEKYNRYLPAEMAEPGQGRKVLLSKNFRSSGGVIDAVNDVFRTNMSVAVGDLDYGTDEMLYEGIPHIPLDEPEVELYGINVKDAVYPEEAAFVAQRIAELLDGTHMVREKDQLRPIRADDIAILLRSPGSVGYYYAKALAEIGIPYWSGAAENLMETEEIQLLRSVLQVIDNPLQDIPLISVLTSKLFCFTTDDLAAFRSGRRNCNIYTALRADEAEKSKAFISMLEKLRSDAKYMNIAKLIKHILHVTGIDCIYASLPDGEVRIENLQSFYKIAADFEAAGAKGLNRFLKHLEALEEKGLAGAGTESSAGAVTIMSIHKSKGLEFPVVFLPALSREFNMMSVSEQLLCDKDLGLGLSCVDTQKRIRYPSVAKRAINAKMTADAISEEMRILYVAMTRARDRLIMCYATDKLEATLTDIVLRMDYTPAADMAAEARRPGKWILRTALQHTEAGAFFAIAGRPAETQMYDKPWKIKVIDSVESGALVVSADDTDTCDTQFPEISRMERFLNYQYPYVAATVTPSKRTATQLKGREKDTEAAEYTKKAPVYRNFRKPSFVTEKGSALRRGTATHAVMQYIQYSACGTLAGVQEQLKRLQEQGYITDEQAELVDAAKIAAFFDTEIGKKLITAKQVLREFKFSVLDDAGKYDPDVTDEEILLQGVVDCAILDDDGIIVIDFKTDRVTEDTIMSVADGYRQQVIAYADALQKIYQMPIKEKLIYFFELTRIVQI